MPRRPDPQPTATIGVSPVAPTTAGRRRANRPAPGRPAGAVRPPGPSPPAKCHTVADLPFPPPPIRRNDAPAPRRETRGRRGRSSFDRGRQDVDIDVNRLTARRVDRGGRGIAAGEAGRGLGIGAGGASPSLESEASRGAGDDSTHPCRAPTGGGRCVASVIDSGCGPPAPGADTFGLGPVHGTATPSAHGLRVRPFSGVGPSRGVASDGAGRSGARRRPPVPPERGALRGVGGAPLPSARRARRPGAAGRSRRRRGC